MPSPAALLRLLPAALLAPCLLLSTWAQSVTMSVEPEQASIGDPIAVTLEVEWPEQAAFDGPALGPRWGKLDVIDEAWSSSVDAPGRWSWSGTLAAFELGELTLPPRTLVAIVDGESRSVQSPAGLLTIVSVLESPEDDGALSELRSQAAISPELTALIVAIALLLGLLALAGLLWWWQRRRAQRPRPKRVRPDPFARRAPHDWIYAELQQLLEQKLPERGELVRFYSELSQILKAYLSGRFRVDLAERTSEEVPEVLEQAGVARADIDEVRRVLGECDGVKFAAARPDAPEWKAVVERIYRIVDRTKSVAGPARTTDSEVA